MYLLEIVSQLAREQPNTAFLLFLIITTVTMKFSLSWAPTYVVQIAVLNNPVWTKRENVPILCSC